MISHLELIFKLLEVNNSKSLITEDLLLAANLEELASFKLDLYETLSGRIMLT